MIRTISGHDAVEGELKAAPKWSCAHGHLGALGKILLALTVIAFCSAFVWKTALIANAMLYLASAVIIFMALFRLAALFFPAPLPLYDPKTDQVATMDLPFYTVLVPLYHEAHMVKTLMRHLRALDYPPARLEILMICEGDDAKTLRAVRENLEPPFKLIVVAPSQPRTKPKALNVAMREARGEIITIYDAEDRPHPLQLREAALALARRPKLGAVQAPLFYFNSAQNWMTRQFAIEYAALFYVINPFFARLGLPFPLGGTSNHIRRTALDAVGGWDPHNVTEDADLSFRLYAFGWSIGSIARGTAEEAVSHYPNWRAQRTRWLKGFLQTAMVHLREPFRGGLARPFTLFASLGLTLAAAFLHLPAIMAMVVLGLYKAFGVWEFSPGFGFWAVMAAGYLGAIAAGAIGLWRAQNIRLWPFVFMMPLYWLLFFSPALRAVGQLLTRPFYWNKTRHGDSLDPSVPEGLLLDAAAKVIQSGPS